MTDNHLTPIRRNANGSLDTAYYAAIGRKRRSEAFTGLFRRKPRNPE